MSKILVNELAHTNDTTAMTIDSSGNVAMSQASVDFWRLTANFASNATITGWERPDDGFNASINGVTESSGVFTFTKTGLYLINVAVWGQNATTADGSFGAQLKVSNNNGSSYDALAVTYSGDSDTGSNNGSSMQGLINVTNISTFKFLIEATSLASGTTIRGATDQNYTHFSSIKLAPAQ